MRQREMKIAITSGKGGTGKTTVSTSLFQILAKYMQYNVQLLDCDVEEPNCHIFIRASDTAKYPVNISIPEIDPEKCTFCGRCKSACAFNAIVMLPSAKFIEVSESLCHGCGACTYVCPERAVMEKSVEIGQITHFDYYVKDGFIEGSMKVGKALQTRVIRETIKHANGKGIVLFDSPPGTSCPVVVTVLKADYVVMVTEPTPFGLHDLKLVVETVQQLGKKHGIIVNKAGLNYKPLYDYIFQNDILLIGEIPFREELAGAYSKGEIIAETSEEMKKTFTGIVNKILNGKTI
jgi:MinD superfamily P-loop ATPase